MKHLLIFTSLLALAACADKGSDEIDKSAYAIPGATEVTPKNEEVKARLTATHGMKVHTFEMVDGTRTEVEGADCVLENDIFSATVKSPEAVNVPEVIAPKPTPLVITCSKDGKTGTMSYSPVLVMDSVTGLVDTSDQAEPDLTAYRAILAKGAYVYNAVLMVSPLQVGEDYVAERAQIAVKNFEIDLK